MSGSLKCSDLIWIKRPDNRVSPCLPTKFAAPLIIPEHALMSCRWQCRMGIEPGGSGRPAPPGLLHFVTLGSPGLAWASPVLLPASQELWFPG